MRQRVVLEAYQHDAQQVQHWLYLSVAGESHCFQLSTAQLEGWGLLDDPGRLIPQVLDSLWLELNPALEIVALRL